MSAHVGCLGVSDLEWFIGCRISFRFYFHVSNPHCAGWLSISSCIVFLYLSIVSWRKKSVGMRTINGWRPYRDALFFWHPFHRLLTQITPCMSNFLCLVVFLGALQNLLLFARYYYTLLLIKTAHRPLVTIGNRLWDFMTFYEASFSPVFDELISARLY